MKINATHRLKATTINPEKKDFVLTKVTELGKSIARDAEPQSWSTERHDNAKEYQKYLPAMRLLYSRIKRASTEAEIIVALKEATKVINTGIEHNGLRLLKGYIDGSVEPDHPSFTRRW